MRYVALRTWAGCKGSRHRTGALAVWRCSVPSRWEDRCGDEPCPRLWAAGRGCPMSPCWASTTRRGRWGTNRDGEARLLDVVAGRSAAGSSRRLTARPEGWRQAIRFGVLDLSGPYRKTFDDSLGHVAQVADPFCLAKPANSKLDDRGPPTRRSGIGEAETIPGTRARRPPRGGHHRLAHQPSSPARPTTIHDPPQGSGRRRLHPAPPAHSDRRLAPRTDIKRTHRSRQLPHQTHRLRIPTVPQPSDPDPPHHPHPPPKSDESVNSETPQAGRAI